MPWELQYLRDNYGKLTVAQMSEHLGRTPVSTKKRLQIAKISNNVHPSAYNTRMEAALTPAECDKMRSFLRALVHYSNIGKIDVPLFMQIWRENECGYVNWSSTRQKATGG